MHDTIKLICENKPHMVAHRGMSGLEKENTHAAFVAAGNRTHWGIETDLHRTLDGKYVCIHDGNTSRVAVDSINVEECTFDTVRKIRLCGVSGEKDRADICIPSLEEYIAICCRYDKVAVTELKGPWEKEHVAEVCEIISEGGWLHKTVFIAFDLQNLVYLRELCPDQPAQFLVGGNTDGVCEALNRYSLDLDISDKALTPELAQSVKGDGHKINVWTVDTVEDAMKAVDMGADYITSNILE